MRIDAHEVIDRGVNVGHVVGSLDSVIAQFVSCPISYASLDSTTSHPNAEAK